MFINHKINFTNMMLSQSRSIFVWQEHQVVCVRVYNSFLISLNLYAQHFKTLLRYFETRFFVVVIEKKLYDDNWRVRKVNKSDYKWYFVFIDRIRDSSHALIKMNWSICCYSFVLLLLLLLLSYRLKIKIASFIVYNIDL